MRLPSTGKRLSFLNIPGLTAAILERRECIRNHRDMRGDDRCFLDDYLVWDMRDDSPLAPSRLPSWEQGMQLCRAFYFLRRADIADPTPPDAILDYNHWDSDLAQMTKNQLLGELVRIQGAIGIHRDIGDRPRTREDDRTLYAILPEKIPADFTLPPEDEFLGETKAPFAGCPSFWRSHADCATHNHNLHKWGPCR